VRDVETHPQDASPSRGWSRASKSALALALVVGLASTALWAQAPGGAANEGLAAGDAAWARRADGHQGGKAAPGPIGEAVAAYEKAVKAEPERLEASWKLLRALHYKGEYATPTQEGKQKVFGRGREVVEAAFDRLAKKVGGRAKHDAKTPAQVAKAYAGDPEAIQLFFWGGVHWGLWGDAFGRLAAARQGVGDKVRRYSEITIALDERFEEAAGHRVLGRLHALAPKIPFITGWVDHDKAITELRRSLALAPQNLDSQLFLAEALFEYQSQKAAEARRILQQLVARQPNPARVVEEEKTIADAKALLAKNKG
jgi:tetratricopeptide (TPR) repeat protein